MLVIVYPFYAPIFMPAGKARYSRTRRFASPAAKIFSPRVLPTAEEFSVPLEMAATRLLSQNGNSV